MFTGIPLPEPSTLILLASGMAILLLLRQRVRW
jgi:PEP-CTERM motif